MQETEAMERATLAAVPPAVCEEMDGWLLGLDPGTVGRAHSAVPLSHEAPDLGLLPRIEARYAAHGLDTVLRLPCVPAFDAMHAAIAGSYGGNAPPVLVQTSTPGGLAGLLSTATVQLDTAPDQPWEALFLGEGFDATDGASRVAILRRARDQLFGSVRIDGQVAAVGTLGFGHGWAGVHGMRTAPAFRGRGLAASILRAFGEAAAARGVRRVLLQVEERNTPAQSIYRRAGFATAWTYRYWRKPAV